MIGETGLKEEEHWIFCKWSNVTLVHFSDVAALATLFSQIDSQAWSPGCLHLWIVTCCKAPAFWSTPKHWSPVQGRSDRVQSLVWTAGGWGRRGGGVASLGLTDFSAAGPGTGTGIGAHRKQLACLRHQQQRFWFLWVIVLINVGVVGVVGVLGVVRPAPSPAWKSVISSFHHLRCWSWKSGLA